MSARSITNHDPQSKATVFHVVGVFEDAWCEPEVSFNIAVDQPITQCGLRVWLKPEPGHRTSRFAVRFGTAAAFGCDVPHDRVVDIWVACPAAPGDVLEAFLTCDNRHTAAGDARPLSFVLNEVSFS